MKANELEYCSAVFEEIKRIPISKVLWEWPECFDNPNILRPLVFRDIDGKLSNRLYPSILSFFEDIKLVIENALIGSATNSLRHCVARQLKSEIAAITGSIRLVNLQIPYEVVQYLDHFGDSVGNMNSNVTLTKEPAAEFFGRGEDRHTVNYLRKCVKLLVTPTLLMQFVKYIGEIQPEVVIIDEVVQMHLSMLTEENLKKVSDFITELLKKAASGEIDPFVRPFGTKIREFVIQDKK